MRALVADAILALHLAIALFIVLGLAAIWIGAMRHWQWTRNFWFRTCHVVAICIVAIESLLGFTCPLTVWEDALRYASGQPSFVARWMRRLLFYEFPEWVFTIAYVACAAATLLAWRVTPPRRRSDPRA